jgi:hypothetical protein
MAIITIICCVMIIGCGFKADPYLSDSNGSKEIKNDKI